MIKPGHQQIYRSSLDVAQAASILDKTSELIKEGHALAPLLSEMVVILREQGYLDS